MNSKEPRSPSESSSLIRRALSALPGIFVLALIGAVGLWGHHTGWRAPKFATLFGAAAPQEAEDWCPKHNVPDSRCIACHPELAGENAADWCKEHGVPEWKCTVCHPEILTTGIASDWCKEHGVPESGYTICHPELARKGDVPAREDDVKVSSGESATGAVGPAGDPRTCQKHNLKVQFASAGAVTKAGVRLGLVVERPMADSITANSELDYDRTHFSRLSSRVPGVAWRVEKKLGDNVVAGEPLVWISAPEVGKAKAEFLQAYSSKDARSIALERLQRSAEAGYRTEAERLDASAAVREADSRLFSSRQALSSLGISVPDGAPTEAGLTALGVPEALRKSLSADAPLANLMPVVAPFDGVIVSRDVSKDEVVDGTRVLFEVADTRKMTVRMRVTQADAARLALGQTVIFRPQDAADEVATGALTWLSSAVDEKTRTVEAIAEVDNPKALLRANSFGMARIVVRESTSAVAVPTESIQWEGCCHVVFVRISDDVFETRKVRLGAKDASYTEVLVGLLPHEVVVTTGSHVLLSEIMKSNFGAGCCADD